MKQVVVVIAQRIALKWGFYGLHNCFITIAFYATCNDNFSTLVLNFALNGSGQDFMGNCQGKKILDLAPTRPTNCDLLISLLLCISWALKLYLF
jgi:hypothetical protein